MRNKGIERKRIIVFGFEGKNNKTESNYFSHFKPKDSRYILKMFSCGKTDPQGMISSAKQKRKDYDYKSGEDLTFLFIDCDCNEEKKKFVKDIQSRQPKDILIITSNPCFELWFFNHFCKSTKEFSSSADLINDLNKFILNYSKNKDYYEFLKCKMAFAIENSRHQNDSTSCKSVTEVYKIIDTIICEKNEK